MENLSNQKNNNNKIKNRAILLNELRNSQSRLGSFELLIVEPAIYKKKNYQYIQIQTKNTTHPHTQNKLNLYCLLRSNYASLCYYHCWFSCPQYRYRLAD